VVGPIISKLVSDADVVEGFCSDLLATATVDACAHEGVPVALNPLAHRDQWGTDACSARAYSLADAIAAMLNPDAALYREMGVEPRRIHEVGVPVPAVQPGGGERLRKERGISGPLVLYLGRRQTYKGYGVLLEAARDIEASVAFVGPGPPLPDDSPRNALDIGIVSASDRDAWLDAADILVLPSSGETFGAVIVEAWSVATPVVTSDHPALRTLVEKGEGGIAVPAEPDSIGQAVSSLLEDPELRQQLGRNGQEHWRNNYTVSAVAAKHELMYRTIGAASRSHDAYATEDQDRAR
jgi:glycosyltransferase involved in cell wall biosynthesis